MNLSRIAASVFLACGLSLLHANAAEKPNMEFLKPLLQGNKVDSVSSSAIGNLYEVRIGSEIFYLSSDGRYLVRGEVMDLMNNVNVTEESRSNLRLGTLKKLDQAQEVIFPANGKTRHVIHVFTDIDCGYCRTLHSQIKNYNNLGIEVRYLAFPRGGLYSDSYQKAVNVWCSSNPQKAMTEAKSGQNLPVVNCGNKDPVKEQYNLGLKLGINGTPAIIMENGQLLPGYMAPKELFDTLEHLSKKKSNQRASLR